jgi:hypothetical protein
VKQKKTKTKTNSSNQLVADSNHNGCYPSLKIFLTQVAKPQTRR